MLRDNELAERGGVTRRNCKRVLVRADEPVLVERHLHSLHAELVYALAQEGHEALGRDGVCDLLVKALVGQAEQLLVLAHAVHLKRHLQRWIPAKGAGETL